MAEDLQDLEELGRQLRQLRVDRGETKADLAARAGLTDGYVGNLEAAAENSQTRRPTRPSVTVVRALADALGAERAPLLELAGWPADAEQDRTYGSGHWVDVVRVVDPLAYHRIEELARTALTRAQALGGHVTATVADPAHVERLTAAALQHLGKSRTDRERT